jgi:orotidine-5'-phosphate decarboxylase
MVATAILERSLPMPAENRPARTLPARMEDRLIVALDLPSVAAAREIAARLDGIVSFFKLGLWLIFAPGFEAFLDDLLRGGKKIFLDAKMFDIGETVRRGVERVAERGVSFVTIHGDGDIIRAAVEGRGDGALKLLVVAVLTSLNERGLRELGHSGSVAELIADRARFAHECGVDGIIASPQDNPNAIRKRLDAERLLVVTPGVRLAGAALDDHKRSGTPAQAIADGADYLVVGRPVVQADDPGAMAARIIADMKSGA